MKPTSPNIRFLHSHRASLVCLALTMLCGCSLYRSADRDSFDANALAGAPKKATVTSSSCAQVSATSVSSQGLDLSAQFEDSQISSEGAIARVIIARRLSMTADDGTIDAAICRVEFASGYSADLLASTSRTELDSFLAGPR